MGKSVSISLLMILFISSCMSNELKEPQKYNYTSSGALTDDCFQVIITTPPDRDLKTMVEQRENAFIKAKDSIISETEKQILLYYSLNNSISIDSISPGIIKALKEKSNIYSKNGIIDQEYYLSDNSAVLVYRVFKNGIKNEILNK